MSGLSFHRNADDLLGTSYNKRATVQAMSQAQYDRIVQKDNSVLHFTLY